jgi:ribulose-phosphate 3-epimerase
MDGHFVPNLTLGPNAVSAINKSTNLFLDVHLMIYNPFDYIEAFVAAGADRITFHFEATEDVEDTLNFIRKCGKQAGLAFRPETSFSMVPKYLDKCDLLLLMTVSPGFGGQKFMPEILEKVEMARKLTDKLDIQVDGGINNETGPQCIKAGANVLVSGNYLFHQKDMAKAIGDLRKA